MRYFKTFALLLLAMALLIGFAYLPVITASAQDASFSEVGFRNIRPVELVISQPEDAGSVLGKLALLRDGSFYTVSPSKTNIGQSAIEQVVKDGLNPYYEMELVPYNWETYEFSATPHLVYSETDTDSYAIFWVVTIHWPDIGDDLILYVDDDTGNILYLYYNSSKMLDIYTDYGYLGTLSTTYLYATGLMKIMNDPESFAVKTVWKDESGLTDEHDSWTAYVFWTEEYGIIEIQFWLYKNGFYIYLQ